MYVFLGQFAIVLLIIAVVKIVFLVADLLDKWFP